MAGRTPTLNHARSKKKSFETWSLVSGYNYSLTVGRSTRLLNPQRGMINKWSKRSVKKKRGFLQPMAQLFEVVTSKPLGVRMGNGRGRPAGRTARLVVGRRLLTLYQVRRSPALQLLKLVKKSNLQLKLVQLYY